VKEAGVDLSLTEREAHHRDRVPASNLLLGEGRGFEIAMIKVHAPNMALRIIDDALQAHGGAGVSQDFDLAYSYAGIRTLRLADGPDEVHARAIAKIEYARHAGRRGEILPCLCRGGGPAKLVEGPLALFRERKVRTLPRLKAGVAPLHRLRRSPSPRFRGEDLKMNLFDLTGKVAIITGSSRGIGRAIAEAMADHGAKVVISSRKAEACQEAADAINAKHPGAALVVPANISSKDDLQNLVAETRRRLGRIDILVCNAASNPYYGPMAGISDDQFRKILENNVIATHWLIAMVAPAMVERGEGSIVIVSSIGGLTSSTMIGAYNISKAADLQLARNLAAEFGPSGVRVNCIAPGLIRTDFARALWENPETLKAVTRSTPMRRIGEPHEIAGAAVFLASPASTFMTGQTVVVDGGSTIGVGL